MRYQNRIYIQTENNNVKNKIINIVNMSSDLCEFNKPTYNMSGATKILTGTTINDNNVHIINTGDTFDLTFSFEDNIDSFTSSKTNFKYNIYRYDETTKVFNNTPIFSSGNIEWSTFSGNTGFTDSLLVSDFILDGEYLVKGSYEFTSCTNYLSKLNDLNDTTLPLFGTQYGIYDNVYDNYFILLNGATKPIFELTPQENRTLGGLTVETSTISEDGIRTLNTQNTWTGDVVITLNGLTLSIGEENDYFTTNNTITFNSDLNEGDLVTIAYVTNGNLANGLVSQPIIVDSEIVSGTTNEQGGNEYYFNTDTGKYEIFMLSEPISFNDIIVTLNGVSLSKNLDYGQSESNTKTIFLNGEILIGDVITITYNSYGSFVGTIFTKSFDIFWSVTPAPSNNKGEFTTIVSSDGSFSAETILFSGTTPYVVNENQYSIGVDLTDYSGDTATYKIINKKDYHLLNGDVISTSTDSEKIPISIQT